MSSQGVSLVSSLLLTLVLTISRCNAQTDSNWTYTLVAPRTAIAGYPIPVSFVTKDPLPAATQLLFLVRDTSDTSVTVATTELPQSDSGEYSVGLPASVEAGSYQIFVVSEPSDVLSGKSIVSSLKVLVKNKSLFILADKPIYKPSQTINFRVFRTDPGLRPLDNGDLSVSVETSEGNKIRQWTKPTVNGIASFSISLADKPPLGEWKIKAQSGEIEAEKTVEIDKYVLPRYEVTVDLPSYWLETEDITGKVAAIYTFGGDVEGTVELTLTLSGCGRETCKATTKAFELTGSAEFAVTSADLQFMRSNKENVGTTLQVVAVVTEGLTGDEQNTTATTPVTALPAKLEFTEFTSSNFKKGLPFTVYVALTKPDGSVIDLADIENKLTIANKNYREEADLGTYTVPADGIVAAEIQPIEGGSVNLEASIEIYGKLITSERKRISVTSVIGLNSITLKLNQASVTAGESISADVSIGVPSMTPMVKYVVVARQKIVASGSHMTSSAPNGNRLTIPTSASFAPQASIIVYAIGDDQEIVADSLTFIVNGALENSVSVRFVQENGAGEVVANITERMPGQPVTVRLDSEASSTVGVLSVDKSILLLGTGNDVTQNDLLKELAVYGDSSDTDSSGGKGGGGIIWCWVPRWGSGSASEIFENAGLRVVSDANIYRIPILKRKGVVLFDGPVFAMGPVAAIAPEIARVDTAADSSTETETSTVRKNFPETWLWDLVDMDAQGKGSIDTMVPDTITSWVTTAFSMSASKGLTVTPVPTNIRVFKDFFIKLDLPYAAVRGEILEVKVLVYNYKTDIAQATITVALSDMFAVSRDANGTPVSEELVLTGVVGPGTSSVLSFYLQASKIGKAVSLDVSATSSLGDRDQLVKQVLVRPEGVEQRVCFNTFVRNDDPSMAAASFEKGLTFEVPFPEDTVADSQYMEFRVTGDVMSSAIKNLDNLISQPYGCGEQNMITFVPNIFVKKYYRASGIVDTAVDKKTTKYMEDGYQRELTYQRKEHSFSAFGQSDEHGSTWLTAFVVWSFQQANRELEGLVDGKVVNNAVKWLLQQRTEEGIFEERGRVIHTEMQGGTSGGPALNAFIVIALLDHPADDRLLSQAQIDSLEPVRVQMVEVLKKVTASATADPYLAALCTYALVTMTGDTSSRAALTAMAIQEDGLMYWKKAGSEPGEDECSGRLCHYARRPDSSQVEMVSYALLAYLAGSTPDLTSASKISKWLAQQQGPNGGFTSTQDTNLALQALSKFAMATYTKDGTLSAGFTANTGEKREFTLEESNSDVLQSYIVTNPAGVTGVEVAVSGNRPAIISVCSWFNVPEQSTTKPEIIVTVELIEDGATNYRLRTCGSNVGGKETGMTVIRAGLITGFSASAIPPNENLKLVEVTDSEAVMYFNGFVAAERCEEIPLTRQRVVMEAKPAYVSAYSYYNEGAGMVKSYSLEQSVAPPPAGGSTGGCGCNKAATKATAIMMTTACLVNSFMNDPCN